MSFNLCHSRGRRLTVPQDEVPLSEKLDQIMTWVDLPLEKRPQFISSLSFPTGRRTRGLMDSSSVRTIPGPSRPRHRSLLSARQRMAGFFLPERSDAYMCDRIR